MVNLQPTLKSYRSVEIQFALRTLQNSCIDDTDIQRPDSSLEPNPIHRNFYMEITTTSKPYLLGVERS